MAKVTIRNISPGARGVRNPDGELIMIERGESAEVELSANERKDAEATGYFAFGGDADAIEEAGDDLSKLNKGQLLDVATAEGVAVETDDNKADLIRKIEEQRQANANT